MTPEQRTDLVKRLAAEAGFAAAGIAPARSLDRRFVDRLQRWVHSPRSAGLAYLRRNEELRADPSRLVPGARNVICLAAGCDPPVEDPGDRAGIVARYARGREYHKHLKKRCRALWRRIEAELAVASTARIFVDSAPVMERSLAARAGLGWIGRNGCLIVPGIGSHVVLAEIVTDLELAPDRPIQGSCGDCGRCLAACPTGALTGDGLLDARWCLSWQSEQTGPVAPEVRAAMGRRIWGCDTCQQVCPHNNGPGPSDPGLSGRRPIAGVGLVELLDWDEAAWDRFTRGRGLRPAGLDVLLRNAALAAGNSGLVELVGPLRRLAARRPGLQSVVAWALGRLGQADGD